MDLGQLTRRGLIGTAAAVAATTAATPGRAGASTSSGRPTSADLVLHGGQVLLMDRKFTVAPAVAIKDGRVVAAGRSSDVRRLVGRRTTVVNLRGRTALPGINDAHLHGVRTGLAMPPYNLDVGPSAVSSITEIAAAVRQAAQSLAPGAWIRGKGWNPQKLAEGRPPTKQDLDAASPDNPVALMDWSNHELWVNSKALEIAGITRDTEAPPGGVIVKDSQGEPTGLLYETAMALVNKHIPAFTREELTGALLNNVSLALSKGITSYTEPGVGAVQRSIYEELAADGRLGIRVTALLSRANDTFPVNAAQVAEILADAGPVNRRLTDLFRVIGVKLRADGVPIGSRTAWMREPYVGGGRGGLVVDGSTDAEKVAELERMVALVHEAGLQVGTHATGDAAIDAVAAAYAKAIGSGDARKQRHYVIHGDFAWPETLRQLAAHDCGISFNPNIKRLIADSQPNVVGEERAAYQSPYAAAVEAGLNVTSASDSPNVAPDWLVGLETVLTRRGMSGSVSGADQRISLRPALHSYTTAGAKQDLAARFKGKLTPGMAGDVCVLGGRLLDDNGRLAVGRTEISDLGIDMTIVAGEVAYSSENADQRRAAARAAAASWAARPNPDGMCAHC